MQLIPLTARTPRQLLTLAKFAIALAIIVGVVALCRRVRIPDVVGPLMAGVVIGPDGV
jgi:Kef-type K+ transport system membrane component KefB